MKRTLLVSPALLIVSGCAASRNPLAASSGDGFLMGLWHGLIIPFSFVISLFKDDVSIYQVANNGGWYNFGFVVGLWVLGMMIFGGTRTVYLRVNDRGDLVDPY